MLFIDFLFFLKSKYKKELSNVENLIHNSATKFEIALRDSSSVDMPMVDDFCVPFVPCRCEEEEVMYNDIFSDWRKEEFYKKLIDLIS